MPRRQYKYYRIIGVMFWAFPYLLWQAFGNISGFFVGVLLAVILTLMLNSLFHIVNRKTPSDKVQQPLQAAEARPRNQEGYQRETEPYQNGYRAATEMYRGEPQLKQQEEHQPQYEEMQVQYPQ